jgi:hypothetical protein
VPDLPTPSASRLQRPSWKDARLAVGLVLVLAATALGSVVVAKADDRVPMYAARGPLVPGQRLTEDDLTRVDVQLARDEARYLSVTQGLPADAYVLREVRAGELVPRSALGGREQVDVQPLMLMVDANSADPLRVGSVVDVYVNPRATDRGSTRQDFAGPELALQAVSVSRLPQTGSRLGSSTAERAVQVMAPRDKIRDIIAKVDLGAKVTLVPVAGSALRADT